MGWEWMGVICPVIYTGCSQAGRASVLSPVVSALRELKPFLQFPRASCINGNLANLSRVESLPYPLLRGTRSYEVWLLSDSPTESLRFSFSGLLNKEDIPISFSSARWIGSVVLICLLDNITDCIYKAKLPKFIM